MCSSAPGAPAPDKGRRRSTGTTSSPRSSAAIPTSCSSPKPTGTWSGNCSSAASISVMTSGSTIAWNMTVAESVRLHLCADLAYQNKLLRFLENHDEPRAAAAFPAAKEKAAAVATSTLPGAQDVSRRPVRRPQGKAAGVPWTPPGRVGRQRSAGVLSQAAQGHRQACVSRAASGACASVMAGPTTPAI